MPINDALQLKERIISIIKTQGPSLPVQIARQTGLSILFASAFLSELYNDKRLNISNIRVGSSPLYFVPGQEPMLENFYNYLKSKEKDAFLLLKENKFLRDSELNPAIRVALREIKDFAIPFRKDQETYWRYFTTSLEEAAHLESASRQVVQERREVIIKEEKEIEPIFEKQEIEKQEEPEETEEEEEKEEIPKKPAKKPKQSVKPKKISKKTDENFFNKIKEFLAKKDIEILDIKNFKDNEAILKVRKKGNEELFFVFNRKKITEKEILKAGKEAIESKMPYSLFYMGEVPKRWSDLISSVKNLSEMGKIE